MILHIRDSSGIASDNSLAVAVLILIFLISGDCEDDGDCADTGVSEIVSLGLSSVGSSEIILFGISILSFGLGSDDFEEFLPE